MYGFNNNVKALAEYLDITDVLTEMKDCDVLYTVEYVHSDSDDEVYILTLGESVFSVVKFGNGEHHVFFNEEKGHIIGSFADDDSQIWETLGGDYPEGMTNCRPEDYKVYAEVVYLFCKRHSHNY